MTVYKFVWKHLGTSEHLYECDADAMKAARKELAAMKNIGRKEQVIVFVKTNGGIYRFIVAYN